MKKYIFILFCLLIACGNHAQRVRFGLVYTPFTIDKITFDKNYIIVNKYTSYHAAENKYHWGLPTAMNLLNAGLFVNCEFKNLYINSELNFQQNIFYFTEDKYDFSQSLKDTSYYYFNYSTLEIPVSLGIRFNRSRKIKIRTFGGITAEIGRISHANFISVFPFINKGFSGAQLAEINREFISKMKPYGILWHVGAGIQWYGVYADLRFEKNLFTFNNSKEDYNANFKNIYVARLVLGFTIPYKKVRLNKYSKEIEK